MRSEHQCATADAREIRALRFLLTGDWVMRVRMLVDVARSYAD